VVWSDATATTNGGSQRTDRALYFGSFQTADGRRVEYRCETTDGQTGVLELDGQRYDLAQGRLFLVATARPATRVRQLNRDVRTLQFSPEAIRALAEADEEITAFFTRRATEERR
jgi:hypothetical protein